MAKAENLPVFLKAVHIQGFKSFADRVKLELGQGLSVIVGPNGSGKSNVADAVRWVLGEQSAKSLRGTKMEDIIFSGSAHRRPVGMAEVSLIFDNSTGIFALDFQEVIITRRVYRDGEGQYFINKAPCRLKDIQELFMDTGAGKEGFSIIGQGRIEEILNLKAEERRNLIEEASGITKYRLRKREATKRLDDTQHNLERLEDILQEIEGQLAPLATQAKVAEESLALSAEQRKLEIQLVTHDLVEIQRKLAGAQGDADSLKERQAEALKELSVAESRHSEEKTRLNQLDEQAQQQQQEVYQAEQTLNSVAHELSLRRERLGYHAEQIARLTQEINIDEKKQHNLKERISSLEGKQAVLKATVAEAAKEVAEREQSLSEARAKNWVESLERLKSDLFSALAEQTKCSNELTGIQYRIDSFEQQVKQLENDRQHKEAELNSAREELLNQQQEAQKAGAKAQELAEEETRLKGVWENTAAKVRQGADELAKTSRQAEITQAKLQTFQAMEDSLEGYQRGVREVLSAKKRGHKACQGLRGTVADILRVEEKFELAVETALGQGLQNVIADNVETAKAGIAYLKANQLGWATFLPLDTIQGQRLHVQQDAAAEPGYIGLAVDLARFAADYRPAMEFLLGRVVVVENMDAATRIARKMGYKARIVTLDGDQVHPGGSLTGGSTQRKGGNLLGRTREMGNLSADLQRLADNKALLEAEYANSQAQQAEARKKMEAVGPQIQEIKAQQAIVKINEEKLQVQLRRLEEDLKILALRKNDATKQQEELALRCQTLTDKSGEAENTVEGLRRELSNKESEAKDAALAIEELSESLTGEKVQLAKLEQELMQAAALLAQEQTARKETDAQLTHKKAELDGLARAQAQIEQEQEELQQSHVEHQERQQKLQYLLVQLRQKREELSARVVESEKAIQKARQETQVLEQKIHAGELLAARWQGEWDTGVMRLTEEFSLSWEEALPYHTVEERSTLWQQILKTKRRIEELGPINQAAIEEYPKSLQRYEFLATQRNDLVDAGLKLRELIAELDKTMSERFVEGFNAVNKAFQEVFAELFNGGYAELRLVDPQNLLETGVEIVAQPPGKKMQLLSLLSGGERALTAIALLFALLRVKPSPFCLLDEIEAALDDANVQRFAQYIHRLAHSTQFIVISHRKGTMEEADILYGITMEESGVSKLLAVKLGERTA